MPPLALLRGPHRGSLRVRASRLSTWLGTGVAALGLVFAGAASAQSSERIDFEKVE